MADGSDNAVTDLSLQLRLENVTGNNPDLDHISVEKGVLGCVHEVIDIP
jgi:hypothetical protein